MMPNLWYKVRSDDRDTEGMFTTRVLVLSKKTKYVHVADIKKRKTRCGKTPIYGWKRLHAKREMPDGVKLCSRCRPDKLHPKIRQSGSNENTKFKGPNWKPDNMWRGRVKPR